MTYREDVPDGTFQAMTSRTIPGTDLVLSFDWHGGAYIDVRRAGDSAAKEVINVWNDGTDQPKIPRTLDAFEQRVDDWIAAYGEGGAEDLAHDVRNNW